MAEPNKIFKIILEIEAKIPEFTDIFLKEGSGTIGVKSFGIVQQLELADYKNDPMVMGDFINQSIDGGFDIFKKGKSLDYATSSDKNRYRVNVSYSNGKILFVIRRLPSKIIKLEALGIDPVFFQKLLSVDKGLFLVSGRTGSGKSTTLGALIEYFNENRKGHIITLENPIELEFKNRNSIINQKELYRDFDSYEAAMDDILREAPNIIMIGEIRNADVLKKAMEISNTGHLVLGTIHGNNAQSVIGKIVRSSENEKEILGDLSEALVGILHQELFYNNQKPTLIIEVLYNNAKVRAGLLNGKYNSMNSIIQTSGEDGMITLAQYLDRYLLQKEIINIEKFKELHPKYMD